MEHLRTIQVKSRLIRSLTEAQLASTSYPSYLDGAHVVFSVNDYRLYAFRCSDPAAVYA